MDSNECGFGPPAGQILTLVVSIDPRTGSSQYLLAGDQFMFTDGNGTRWGPFVLTWPEVDLTLPDDNHDHVHYWFEFTGPATANPEMVFHQVPPRECRIRYSG